MFPDAIVCLVNQDISNSDVFKEPRRLINKSSHNQQQRCSVQIMKELTVEILFHSFQAMKSTTAIIFEFVLCFLYSEPEEVHSYYFT